MALSYRKFWEGIRLVAKAVTSSTTKGDLEVLDPDSKIYYHNGTVNSPLMTEAGTATVTNKTYVVANNTFTTAASGNLTSTELNAALAELQGDIDTNSSGLAAHLADAVDAHDASAISNVPAGTISSTDVQAALNELDGDIQAHITDAVDAHDASSISNIPSGNLAATEVQAALNELQSDIDTRSVQITAKDEGSNLTTAMASINFVGAGVTATNVGTAVTVTIPSGGDVTGPASSTDNHLARFDGTTGKVIQDGSTAVLSDAGALSGLTQLDVDNLRLDGNTISSTDANGNILLDPNGTGNVGINLTNPATILDIRGTGALATAISVVRTLDSASGAASIRAGKARTAAAPSSGDQLGIFGTISENGSDFTRVYSTMMDQVATEAHSSSATGASTRIYSTTNGTNSSVERMRLDNTGGVNIGGATSAVASALLELTSTTRGFLEPRLTTTERDAISSPATGLQVYNTTTNKMNFYNGTSWQELGTSVPSLLRALISDVQTSGTNGGTATSGSFQTRTLNTLSDNGGIVTSLSSNQITLPAGTYYFEITAPCYRGGAHKAKLRNTTDSTDALIGSTEHTQNADSSVSTNSRVCGFVTIAGSKTFEVQHRNGTTQATNGFGIAASFSVSEIYTQVTITKI